MRSRAKEENRVWYRRSGLFLSLQCKHVWSLTVNIGLRGRMEAGFSRMNDLTVIQASQVRKRPPTDLFLNVYSYQGLCAYVLKTVDNVPHRGVIVGHDHRHHSERWAALTAAAFLSQGVKAYLLRGFVHTPL